MTSVRVILARNRHHNYIDSRNLAYISGAGFSFCIACVWEKIYGVENQCAGIDVDDELQQLTTNRKMKKYTITSDQSTGSHS